MIVSSLQLSAKPVYRLLTDSACMATVLHAICLAKYGEEIYEVDPIELYLRLEEDFGTKLPEDNENKLAAILQATSTDIFYEDPEAFRSICNTLGDGDPGLEYLESATLAEMMWGMFEVNANHGPCDLSHGVQRLFMAAMDGEADHDETGENPDPYASLKAYMQDSWNRLARQFADLGVPNREIPSLDPEMASPDPSPLLLQ